jgi:hypothetical protein
MPSQNSVHQDKLLTNVSVAFAQEPSAFVAGRVFPNIPVSKQSDKYLIVDRDSMNRDEMQPRAAGTESAGGSFTYSDSTYFCDVFGLHKDIDDQTAANEDDIYELQANATQWLTTKSLIKKEKLFVSNYFSTGVWTEDIVGIAATPVKGTSAIYWDNVASTPIEDVRYYTTAQQLLTGYRPNVMVMSQTVWDALVDHPDIIDRIKYGTTGDDVSIANKNTVARLFELDEILVMSSVENTAAEGVAESNAFIGSGSALLCYRAKNPGRRVASAGYTFSWTGLNGAYGNLGTSIDRFRMDHLKSERIEIEMAFDQKVISADMGTFFSVMITP